jgi:hypothetical protein
MADALTSLQVAELRGRVAELESRLATLEEAGESQLALMRGQETHEFCFPAWKSGITTVKVGQGYVTAGDRAEYDWPQAEDVQELDFDAMADGRWLIYFELEVDPEVGYWTDRQNAFGEPYRPRLKGVGAAAIAATGADHHKLQQGRDAALVHVVVAEVCVLNAEVAWVQPRRRHDIAVPVRWKLGYDVDENSEPVLKMYYCDWRNYDRRSVALQVVTHARLEGDVLVLTYGYASRHYETPADVGGVTEKCHAGVAEVIEQPI